MTEETIARKKVLNESKSFSKINPSAKYASIEILAPSDLKDSLSP